MKWFSDYVGIPFRTLGRTKEGCDCYGLVRIAMAEHYNVLLPELLEYSDSLEYEETNKVILDNIPLLSGEELSYPKEGSVVVLSNRGLESHIGLMVTDKLMLHTTSANGAVIEPVTSIRIKNRIRGYYNVNKSYSTK
jgi:cell wall-associated NlpC family hydrolase